jgi:hypothetical protein
MADTVDVKVLEDGQRNYVVRLTGISDGTGESAVKKVDISTLGGPDASNPALAPTSFAVKEIEYNVQGFYAVQLHFDATTDDELAILGAGTGYLPFNPPSADPKSSGYTGDIMLTTTGASAGATYDVTLHLIKKQ